MNSSAPSAAREKPFVSGRNSVKQAGGHSDLGASHSPIAMDSGVRGSRDATRAATVQLPCALAASGYAGCGGIRSMRHPRGRDGVAAALEAIAWALPPVSRVVAVDHVDPILDQRHRRQSACKVKGALLEASPGSSLIGPASRASARQSRQLRRRKRPARFLYKGFGDTR